MIYSIRGKIIEKQKDLIVIEAGGIGYEVSSLASAYDKLPEIGEEATVYTQFVVREDAFLLFGFLSAEEKSFFNTLTSVPSIGPKTAFTIMNSIQIPRLVEAIIKEDEKCLTQISGIGAKTAKRIILELKDKLTKLHSASKDSTLKDFGASAASGGPASAVLEARLALGALGFGFNEIEKMLASLSREKDWLQMTTEDIIRLALKKR